MFVPTLKMRCRTRSRDGGVEVIPGNTILLRPKEQTGPMNYRRAKSRSLGSMRSSCRETSKLIRPSPMCPANPICPIRTGLLWVLRRGISGGLFAGLHARSRWLGIHVALPGMPGHRLHHPSGVTSQHLGGKAEQWDAASRADVGLVNRAFHFPRDAAIGATRIEQWRRRRDLIGGQPCTHRLTQLVKSAPRSPVQGESEDLQVAWHSCA